MNKLTMKMWLIAILLMVELPVLAEMDHSAMGHDMSAMPSAKKMMGSQVNALQKLESLPASGEAREGGYDNSYLMESTDAADSLHVRCAQASRGLVMVDNAEWSRCGGKPTGAAEGVLPVKGGEHAGHQM
jgi:hypothetical protein